MKKQLFSGLVALLLFAGCASAQNEPILNIQVRDGKLQDVSPARRPIEAKPLQSTADGSALTLPGGAAKIAYQQGDALYAPGPRTWLVRCKIQKEPKEGYFPLFGQWKASTQERIIAIILKGGPEGSLAFHLTPNGLVDRQLVRMLPAVPDNVWMTLAAQFTPGGEASLIAFDDKGNILGESKHGPAAPAAVFSAPVDFTLSGPASQGGLQLSALQVWNGVLPREQILAALPALGAK